MGIVLGKGSKDKKKNENAVVVEEENDIVEPIEPKR